MDDVTPRSDRVDDDAARAAADRRAARADGIALVVVGYDGSAESAEAVRWADSLARRTRSALRVVWAWKLRDVWDTAVAEDHEAVSPPMRELERVARRRLAEVVAGLLGPDVPHVEIHLRQGPDAADILLHAATDADVLVVGSRGRGRAASAVLGSVSARCVHQSPVPVLVIPHRMVRDHEHVDPDLVAAAPGAGDDETSHA